MVVFGALWHPGVERVERGPRKRTSFAFLVVFVVARSVRGAARIMHRGLHVRLCKPLIEPLITMPVSLNLVQLV